MWQVHLDTTPQPIPNPACQSANNCMSEITRNDMSQWYHATLFSPVNKNIIQSIKKGYFATWTKSTIGLLNKYLPPSMATDKGHMNQKRSIINSTNQQEPMKLEYPQMKPLTQRTNTMFTKIINHTSQIATDLTGKLTVTSNRVNKYLFVLYECDRNSILIFPMRAIPDSKFIRVFKDLHEHLLTRGIKTS